MRRKIIVRGPALSQSGYGEQTRFAMRCLKKHQDKFDLYLMNVGWGRTGWITTDDEERAWLDHLIGKTQLYIQETQGNPQFDVSLQVTVANEFEPIAAFNIGYTAGIETTKALPEWITRCNLMNRIIVPSVHAKTVLQNSVHKIKNQFGSETELKLKVPVDVCGYAAREVTPKKIDLELETSFNFVSIAQWGPRKNIESTISSFVSEFYNEPDVGLILKTNMSKNNQFDKMFVENRLTSFVQNLPHYKMMKCKIYLLHGNLEESEMRGLLTDPRIKGFITTTHGEGFGLPIFESVLSELPVIAPAWSGHVDFLFAPKKDKDTGKMKMKPHFVKIEYDVQPVQKDAVIPNIIAEDSQWCYVKNYSARAGLRELFKNHAPHVAEAKKLKEYVLKEFDENKQFDSFVKSITDSLPTINDIKVSELEQALGNNVLNDIIGL